MIKDTPKHKRLRAKRNYPKVLINLAIASIITYIIVLFFGDILILAEKYVLIEAYRFISINVVDAGLNAVIIFKPEKHIITIVLTVLCLGVFSMIVFSLFVLLVPAIPWYEKLRGLSIGNPILFFANIVRIWVSGVIGVELGSAIFKIVHDVFGAGFMIFLVATLWLDWMYRTSKYGRW
ncbi:MAG: hypothetical protein DRO23_08195 [Thermoprotei archaeon]|nr:MAG: hypothetical protein DRO23_08195 [Thermoprotei archaeon]